VKKKTKDNRPAVNTKGLFLGRNSPFITQLVRENRSSRRADSGLDRQSFLAQFTEFGFNRHNLSL
jgi:hypothetical protein